MPAACRARWIAAAFDRPGWSRLQPEMAPRGQYLSSTPVRLHHVVTTRLFLSRLPYRVAAAIIEPTFLPASLFALSTIYIRYLKEDKRRSYITRIEYAVYHIQEFIVFRGRAIRRPFSRRAHHVASAAPAQQRRCPDAVADTCRRAPKRYHAFAFFAAMPAFVATVYRHVATLRRDARACRHIYYNRAAIHFPPASSSRCEYDAPLSVIASRRLSYLSPFAVLLPRCPSSRAMPAAIEIFSSAGFMPPCPPMR